jgi:hypothetical protein
MYVRMYVCLCVCMYVYMYAFASFYRSTSRFLFNASQIIFFHNFSLVELCKCKAYVLRSMLQNMYM